MHTFTISPALQALQAATLAARKRTGDKSIGTSAERGQITVVCVVPNGRKAATVTALSQPMTMERATDFLNNLTAAAQA